MTFLSDADIRRRMNGAGVAEDERLHISGSPTNELKIGQCSVDLTLSPHFARFRRFPLFTRGALDPRSREQVAELQDRWFKRYTASPTDGFVIRSNEVILAQSNETIRLATNTLGLLTGRSTYSRMGLEVQLTQDLKQPGHAAPMLFQIKNNAPFAFRLYPNMRIAQLLIAQLETPATMPYDATPGSKFAGNKNNIFQSWPTDPELDDKPIVTKASYLKPFLDALLISFGVLTVGAIARGITQFDDPLIVASAAVTICMIAVRLALYFKTY